MSPIRLYHVSLNHPQTPINRSLSKAFLHTETSKKVHTTSSIKEDSKSTKALLESSLKTSKNFKNFNLEYEEHSKKNHPNHLPRS